MPGEQVQQSLAPPPAGLTAPAGGPVDEPPPHGLPVPAPSGRLRVGFWPVPCLLATDDGSARLHLAVAGGTPVHAIVAATVRPSTPPVVEIEARDGRRFRYAPVADVRVAAGDRVVAGAVLGTVVGRGAARLELAVRDPDGRWVDPYPLLVGLADPNELGVDAHTGDGIDPDFLGQRPRVEPAPTPPAGPPAPPAPASAAPVTVEAPTLAAPPATWAAPSPADAPAEDTGAPLIATPAAELAPEPAPAEPPPSRVSADILAAMVAPMPPPKDEPVDE